MKCGCGGCRIINLRQPRKDRIYKRKKKFTRKKIIGEAGNGCLSGWGWGQEKYMDEDWWFSIG
jgi:hypothetical protein